MRRQPEDDMSLRAALRALPRRDPPAAVWERVRAELAATPAAPPRRSRWPQVALAASVALGAAAALFFAAEFERAGDAVPTAAPAGAPPQPDALAALVAESARLERTLVTLPRFDGVVRVGTASTIAGLEDHIAWIDAELSVSEAFDIDPVYRQALWRERVEMMTALIDVQYAQLPATVLLQ